MALSQPSTRVDVHSPEPLIGPYAFILVSPQTMFRSF